MCVCVCVMVCSNTTKVVSVGHVSIVSWPKEEDVFCSERSLSTGLKHLRAAESWSLAHGISEGAQTRLRDTDYTSSDKVPVDSE